jgi:hypothetical protein
MSTDVQLVAKKASIPVIGTKINYRPLSRFSYSYNSGYLLRFLTYLIGTTVAENG